MLANLALLLSHNFRTLRRENFEIRGLGFEFAARQPNKCVHPAGVSDAVVGGAQLPSWLSFISLRRKIVKLNGSRASTESHGGSDDRSVDRDGAS